MDWNDIRIIIEVGRSHSFTSAAITLGTSKATVSRKVSALERMAGTRLFRRTPQGAVLTAQGEAIIERASRIEAEVLDLEYTLRALNQSAPRLVSIKMSEGVASYLITPAMAGQPLGPLGIAARREGIHLPPIRILSPDAPERADMALVWTPKGGLPAAGLASKIRKLTDVSFVPFHSDTYAPGIPRPENLSDLSQHKLLTHDAYRWFSDDGWSEWHRLLGRAKDPISAAWSCSVGHLTLRGAGIGVLPSYAPLYADGILPLKIHAPPMIASLWVVCDADAATDQMVRRCLDMLVGLFTKAEWMAP